MMSSSQQSFTAAHYTPRAADYVTSINHSTGEDLDQIDALLRGKGLARVLDLGCGGGHVSYRAAPHVGEIVACDITRSMLDMVAKSAAEKNLHNVTVQQGAAEHLPFETASFDAVLCRFTAHHWQNMEAGLREARRVLKPDSDALFIDVVSPADPVLDTHLQTVELLRDVSHIRNYTVAEWVASLTRAGFVLQSLTPRKLRMDFPVWIARTNTPDIHAAAIRSLQIGATDFVKDHFMIAEDGGFDLDTATFVVA